MISPFQPHMLKMSEISPIRAPFLSSILTYYMENLVKPPVSVRVENTPKSRFVCKNTVDLHLAKSPPKALKPRLFSPPTLPHSDPGNPAGMRI
jgi:hypothetical protein